MGTVWNKGIENRISCMTHYLHVISLYLNAGVHATMVSCSGVMYHVCMIYWYVPCDLCACVYA